MQQMLGLELRKCGEVTTKGRWKEEKQGLYERKCDFCHVFSFQTQVLGESNESAIWYAFFSLGNI